MWKYQQVSQLSDKSSWHASPHYVVDNPLLNIITWNLVIRLYLVTWKPSPTPPLLLPLKQWSILSTSGDIEKELGERLLLKVVERAQTFATQRSL